MCVVTRGGYRVDDINEQDHDDRLGGILEGLVGTAGDSLAEQVNLGELRQKLAHNFGLYPIIDVLRKTA